MVHKRKKEWCESHLSTLPRKLGSGKTRRIGNMKEESTPYDGADSLKQICVPSTYQFTRFQLTEPFACRVHKIVLLQHWQLQARTFTCPVTN